MTVAMPMYLGTGFRLCGTRRIGTACPVLSASSISAVEHRRGYPSLGAAMAETLILNRAEIEALVSPLEALEPSDLWGARLRHLL
jgi:hypothetical protein